MGLSVFCSGIKKTAPPAFKRRLHVPFNLRLPGSILFTFLPSLSLSLPPLLPHPLFSFIRSCFCLSPEPHQCLNQSIVWLMFARTEGKAIAMREAFSNLSETNVFGYNTPDKMRPFAFITFSPHFVDVIRLNKVL